MGEIVTPDDAGGIGLSFIFLSIALDSSLLS